MDALMNHPVNQAVAEVFRAANVPLFLVGGSVRDALSGTPDFSDLDYTTPARPEEIKNIVSHLGSIWLAGQDFGTIAVQVKDVKVEITTFRTEVYNSDSRKPEVGFGDTLADDLKRRDLTINAMALCLVGDDTFNPGMIVDLFGGREDLKNGVLRTPDLPEKSMSEDPLRQMRVVRFAVKRNMTVAPLLGAAIKKLSGRMSIVAVERRTMELEKVLALGPAVFADALELAHDLRLDSAYVGALPGDMHVQRALRRLPSSFRLHSLAVPALAHLKSGGDPQAALVAMRLSLQDVKSIMQVVNAAEAMTQQTASVFNARSLVRKNSTATLQDAVEVVRACMEQFPVLAQLVEAALDAAQEIRQPLPVSGEDMLAAGLRGPAVGAALYRVEVAFLTNLTLTKDEALALI